MRAAGVAGRNGRARIKGRNFRPNRWHWSLPAAGLPVVIVNPTAPMGDHDFKPTPTGQDRRRFPDGAMPAYIDTGLNVVNVRDVALGHLLACERGRAGERYILGSENLTLGQILKELAAITGRKAPTVELPYFVAYDGRRSYDGVGASDGHSAARSAGSRTDGEEKDVGFACEGGARTGIQPRAGQAGAGRRGRVV